jgi:Flp pilus assembly protein TadD
LKHHDQAIAAFVKALELRPDDARAHARLGKAMWLGGKASDAIAHLQRAVTLAPENGEYWSVYGKALASAGQGQAAIEALRKASQLRPSDVGSATRLAWELATSVDANVRDGKSAVALAEELCRKTNDADPDTLDALAAAYAETGKFAEAVATAAKAVELASRSNASAAAKGIQARIDLYRKGQPFHQLK